VQCARRCKRRPTGILHGHQIARAMASTCEHAGGGSPQAGGASSGEECQGTRDHVGSAGKSATRLQGRAQRAGRHGCREQVGARQDCDLCGGGKVSQQDAVSCTREPHITQDEDSRARPQQTGAGPMPASGRRHGIGSQQLRSERCGRYGRLGSRAKSQMHAGAGGDMAAWQRIEMAAWHRGPNKSSKAGAASSQGPRV